MKKHLKNISTMLLLIAFVISSYLPVAAVGQPESYSASYNSGERDVICTTLDGTGAEEYYTGAFSYESLSVQSSKDLLSAVRSLMTSTHKKKTSYAECKSYSPQTDCQNEDGTVVLLYTSYVAEMDDFIKNNKGWNREHVWPKYCGGFDESLAGSDLHHIRPSDCLVNSKRNNNKYGNVSSGTQATGSALVGGMSGGVYSGGYFEPHNNVKGDVARICLYVYARWGSDFTKCSDITNVFESVDVLLEWCEMDPVDTWEMGRNEVVESIQGNRNVFIDYPELAWVLFDREIPADMTTPSGEAKKNAPESNVCDHAFGEWTLSADGVTYESTCSECGEVQILTIEALVASLDSDAEKILLLLTLGASDSLLFEEVSN